MGSPQSRIEARSRGSKPIKVGIALKPAVADGAERVAEVSRVLSAINSLCLIDGSLSPRDTFALSAAKTWSCCGSEFGGSVT